MENPVIIYTTTGQRLLVTFNNPTGEIFFYDY
jgi:hypothetical protein